MHPEIPSIQFPELGREETISSGPRILGEKAGLPAPVLHGCAQKSLESNPLSWEEKQPSVVVLETGGKQRAWQLPFYIHATRNPFNPIP